MLGTPSENFEAIMSGASLVEVESQHIWLIVYSLLEQVNIRAHVLINAQINFAFGFARVRTTEIRISEGLLYYFY